MDRWPVYARCGVWLRLEPGLIDLARDWPVIVRVGGGPTWSQLKKGTF